MKNHSNNISPVCARRRGHAIEKWLRLNAAVSEGIARVRGLALLCCNTMKKMCIRNWMKESWTNELRTQLRWYSIGIVERGGCFDLCSICCIYWEESVPLKFNRGKSSPKFTNTINGHCTLYLCCDDFSTQTIFPLIDAICIDNSIGYRNDSSHQLFAVVVIIYSCVPIEWCAKF